MTEFEKVDADGSGNIDKSEWDALALENRKRVLDDEDAQRDAQRKMTWFALSGMLLFPALYNSTSNSTSNSACSAASNLYPPLSVAAAIRTAHTCLVALPL